LEKLPLILVISIHKKRHFIKHIMQPTGLGNPLDVEKLQKSQRVLIDNLRFGEYVDYRIEPGGGKTLELLAVIAAHGNVHNSFQESEAKRPGDVKR
jgi:hypothetical protein